VLKRTRAEGEIYQGEDDVTDATSQAESIEAPDLMPATPEETTASEAQPDVNLLAQSAAPNAADSKATPRKIPLQDRGLSGGTTDYAKVSVFGVQGTGTKFVYVFDRSSSMEGPPLAAAKKQLIESFKSLDTVHQFHIIFFNQRLKSMDITGGGRRVAFATDRNKQLAANFVGGITADGGTDRFIALKRALAFRPDVVFFLSDADDPMPASELKEIARLNERLGAAICAIEFGRTPTKPQNNFLMELSRQSGGQYGYVNAAKLQR
jgi:hypothetical protein